MVLMAQQELRFMEYCARHTKGAEKINIKKERCFMKKALSLVLAAALAAGALSGCGSGSQSNTSGNNQGGGRKKQRILMALLLAA